MHTGPTPMLVTAEVTFDLVTEADHGVPVHCVLEYAISDPFCVTAMFVTGHTEVRWVFARELLEAGLTAQTGEGDVLCWPIRRGSGEPVVGLSLRSPSGQARLEAPLWKIRDFLDRTYHAVPAGSESRFMDVDGLIDNLLSEF